MTLIYKKSPHVLELEPKDFRISNLGKRVEPNFNQPILIVFYAHWCPHCSNPTMVEFVESLASVLPHKSNVKVGAFNCDHSIKNRDIANNMKINGFPTIRYFNRYNKSSDYTGPRDVRSILNFLIKNS